MLRLSSLVFTVILELIQKHHVFSNNSNIPQTPVNIQLAITLYHLGHYSNAASFKMLRDLQESVKGLLKP
jgi:hypothetical protein